MFKFGRAALIVLFSVIVSAGCAKNRRAPVFSNLEWRSADTTPLEKAQLDDTVKICLDAEGIDDGSPVRIEIFDYFAAYEEQDSIDAFDATVHGGKIEAGWKIIIPDFRKNRETNFAREIKAKNFSPLDYYFSVSCNGYLSGRSGLLSIRGYCGLTLLWEGTRLPLVHVPVRIYFPNGEETTKVTDENGVVTLSDIVNHGEIYFSPRED